MARPISCKLKVWPAIQEIAKADHELRRAADAESRMRSTRRSPTISPTHGFPALHTPTSSAPSPTTTASYPMYITPATPLDVENGAEFVNLGRKGKLLSSMEMVLPVANATAAALARVSAMFNAPLARAVVFGIHIDGHLVVEGLLIAAILFQLSRKSYKPPKKPLTEREVDELCDEWQPEPLCPPIKEGARIEAPTLESAAGPHTIVDGKEVVNFASANYLGLIGNEKILGRNLAILLFSDVHLDCETKIAKFLGTQDSILYSYGISTIFSVIPAFCKKGDIIVADEGVHWAVQNGLQLSRSTVVYFKHNDMASLASTLEKLTHGNKRTEKIRRYIVVEAIYQNSGQIAPLDEIVRLKEKYRFRVILEESHSFGVLGKSGRGLAEHYGVPIEKIDIITAGMGNALATDGGFCTGSIRVVDHQRLSSSGYVFSASLPPYLASAAISAVDHLEENPSVLANLRSNITLLHKELSDVQGLEIASNILSPIVFLKLKTSTGSAVADLELLEVISEKVLKEDSVFIAATKRSSLDKCRLPVGIRLFVSAGHTESDILKVSESLKRVAASVL
uniref:serine C-palmitoyltransferase n=1 Tax=Oryza sativa TaxID=4530 RepID=Q948H0_ORYSA|nr:Putative serine palmitoyltransferase [Oryza sativa Japonica Group]